MPYETPENKIQKSLTKNSFISCILEGFDIFSLLNQLVEVIPEDKVKLEHFKDEKFMRFFLQNSGNIEVTTEFDCLRLYFPLQPKCQFLTEATKMQFLMDVERESTNHKLLGLCGGIPSFIEEMEHLEIMSHQRIQITPTRLERMQDLSTLLALTVGGIIISTYKYEYIKNEDGSENYQPFILPLAKQIIFGLGCVQAVTSFMLVVGFVVNKSNLII